MNKWQLVSWRGRPIEELSREDLVEALTDAANIIKNGDAELHALFRQDQPPDPERVALMPPHMRDRQRLKEQGK